MTVGSEELETKTYSYDVGGNRTGECDPYNRLRKDENTQLNYDNEGNVIARWTYKTLLPGDAGAADYHASNMSVSNGWYRFVLLPLKVQVASEYLRVTIWFGTQKLPDWNTHLIQLTQLPGGGWGTTDPQYFNIKYTGGEQGNITLRVVFTTSGGDGNQLVSGGFRLQQCDLRQGYIYDHHNRLQTVEVDTISPSTHDFTHTQTITYTYDVFGNRIAEELRGVKSSAGNKSTYYVNEGGHAVLQFNAAKQLESRKLYGPAVDQILANDEVLTGTTSWALADRQGTVRNVFYRSGGELLTEHLLYDAFGKPDWNVGESIDHARAMDAFYAGRPFDWETHFVYMRARNLDTDNGRMNGEDDIGLLSGDTNFYRYCFNSPADYTDPSGMVANWVAGGIVGGIVGAVGYSIFHTGEFTWGGFIGATTTGAVTGAIIGGTMGASLVVGLLAADTGGMAGLAAIGVTSTVVGNMAGEAAQQIVEPQPGGWSAIINKDRRQEAEVGAVMAIVGGYTVPVAEAYAPAVVAWLSRGWRAVRPRPSQVGAPGTEVILSQPHNNGTPGHWDTILGKVDDLKQTGDYETLYGGRKYLSNEVDIPDGVSNRAPDVWGVRRDRGIIDQWEVPSKTDNILDLLKRMDDSRRLILGDRAGTIGIEPIR